eukprot:scaffold2754_cov401-Pinguiococcus_pyrenoidosus.AAC.2
MYAIWPHWASPLDRRESFKKVGIEQDRVQPQNVDRTSFAVKPVTPLKFREEVTPVVDSPVGPRRGSLEYYKGKLSAAMAVIDELRNIPLLPEEAGIMQVSSSREEAYTARGDRRRVRSEYGSFQLRQLYGEAKEISKRVGDGAGQAKNTKMTPAQKAAAEDLREKLARDAAAKREAEYTAFKACRSGSCACGDRLACRFKELRACAFCHCVQKGFCRKNKCKKARAEAKLVQHTASTEEAQEAGKPSLGDSMIDAVLKRSCE